VLKVFNSKREVKPTLREEAEEHLKQVKDWKLINNSIEKNYKFSNFMQAIEFINKVANVAEEENHHPDILLWGWNNVKLTLTTHAVKGLSKNDFSLASRIDQIKLG
jgi:4a-hydroxytetrahydrobiopterin dehydratase